MEATNQGTASQAADGPEESRRTPPVGSRELSETLREQFIRLLSAEIYDLSRSTLFLRERWEEQANYRLVCFAIAGRVLLRRTRRACRLAKLVGGHCGGNLKHEVMSRRYYEIATLLFEDVHEVMSNAIREFRARQQRRRLAAQE